MKTDILLEHIISDLKRIKMPVDEVDIFLRPYSRTYYGRYFPVYDEEVAKARIFIYPYEDEKGNMFSYTTVFETAVHEMVHHIQHTSSTFKRHKGVMHDMEFWKLYNHYTSRARALGITLEDSYEKSV